MITATREDAAISPRPVILGFLMLGPRHPYDLFRVYEAGLGRVWRVGRSHLYAHLDRLVAEGLVAVRTEAAGPRPARHVCRITPAGEAAFREWVARPSTHVRHLRLEFLARLYFHRALGLPGLDRLVRRQKELLASRAASVKAAMRASDDEYWRLVLDFRHHEMRAASDWLAACGEVP